MNQAPPIEPASTLNQFDCPVQTQALIEPVVAGDSGALDQHLACFQPELLAFVECRIDPQLRARFNGSDVVQEALMEATRRMDDYLERRPMPFHLWIRKTAYERLLNLHRDHRRQVRRSWQTQSRDPGHSKRIRGSGDQPIGVDPLIPLSSCFRAVNDWVAYQPDAQVSKLRLFSTEGAQTR